MTVLDVSVWLGSIGEADADVLVNASNTQLRLGSGVSAAISRACGDGYQAVLNGLLPEVGFVEPGETMVTTAHRHPRARHVAHVAVMDYRDAWGPARPDEARLRRGYRSLFRAVETLGESDLSIAIVALGAGTGGFSLRQSVGMGCEALKEAQAAVEAPKVTRAQFVAYDVLECANMLDTVRQHFAVDTAGVDPRVVEMASVMAGTG